MEFMNASIIRSASIGILAAVLVGCTHVVPEPLEASAGHLQPDPQAPAVDEIPGLVEQTPFLPPPVPQPELQKYTVVVNEVPVKELLFALARDASLNVDIGPRIEGVVTLNAVDQTLPQILDRIARQVDVRYELRDSNLVLLPDEPYFRTYKVDYVNLTRDTTSLNSVATQIATTGVSDFGVIGGGGSGVGGGNNSTTTVSSASNHRFWITLTQNILAILGDEQSSSSGLALPVADSVIVNPESGIINVRATSRQHEQIQSFIDAVLVNAQRQVLIEATIVEVALNDDFEAGVDWSFVARTAAGFVFQQNLLATDLLTAPFFSATYQEDRDTRLVDVTTRLLKRFGDIKVLSSPKLMVLNNQTALLKVVDNVVYFTVEQENNTTQGVVTTTFESTVHTVPVGFVMSVTPQINENTVVTMNVRPTISRVLDFVNDPNPALTVPNPVPIITVREMESVLKVNSGQIAILGGLMQDTSNRDTRGVPVLSDIPALGNGFKVKKNSSTKNELVIFLRPVIMYSPSLDGDLADFRPYLESDYGLTPKPVR